MSLLFPRRLQADVYKRQGLDRLLLAIEETGITLPSQNQPVAYVVAVSKADNQEAFTILTRLRRAGIASDKDYRETSLRAQLKACLLYTSILYFFAGIVIIIMNIGKVPAALGLIVNNAFTGTCLLYTSRWERYQGRLRC